MITPSTIPPKQDLLQFRREVESKRLEKGPLPFRVVVDFDGEMIGLDRLILMLTDKYSEFKLKHYPSDTLSPLEIEIQLKNDILVNLRAVGDKLFFITGTDRHKTGQCLSLEEDGYHLYSFESLGVTRVGAETLCYFQLPNGKPAT